MIVHLHINMLRLDLKSKQIRTYSSETSSRIFIKGAFSNFCLSLLGFAGFLGFWGGGACGAAVAVAPGTSSITASLSSPHIIHGFNVGADTWSY